MLEEEVLEIEQRARMAIARERIRAPVEGTLIASGARAVAFGGESAAINADGYEASWVQ